MPSLNDKLKFLPSVLRDTQFQLKGVLFGQDSQCARDCQWVVVDPNRHKLFVWKKPTVSSDYFQVAKTLKASVFTDGTQQHEVGESGGWTYFRYLGAEWEKFASDPTHQFARRFTSEDAEATKKRESEIDVRWRIGDPYGSVIGKDSAPSNLVRGNALLNVQVNIAKTGDVVGYFGRKGTAFESYSIAEGNPPDDLLEAAGGLLPPDLKDGDIQRLDSAGARKSNQWLYWALAPLKPEGKDEAGLNEALAAYAKAPNCAGKTVAGLIVALYFEDDPKNVQILKDIGARQAIRVDGGTSCLFGHDAVHLVSPNPAGYAMKREWLQYGIAFFPY
jgi:hypothetical protein